MKAWPSVETVVVNGKPFGCYATELGIEFYSPYGMSRYGNVRTGTTDDEARYMLRQMAIGVVARAYLASHSYVERAMERSGI